MIALDTLGWSNVAWALSMALFAILGSLATVAWLWVRTR